MNSEQRRKMIEEAKGAFALCLPPDWAEGCTTVQEIEACFGDDYFYELWDLMYHLEVDDIKFLTPLMIEFYLTSYGRVADRDWQLENWLYFWEHFEETIPYVKNRYQSIYASFDSNQRKVICDFLTFIKNNGIGDTLHQDEAIKFWCGNSRNKRGIGKVLLDTSP